MRSDEMAGVRAGLYRTFRIRFINCSPDDRALTVNLQGNDPSQAEFGSLSYKQITSFKGYDASAIGGTYTLKIRDSMLTDPAPTFWWNYSFGKNYTIVISGNQSAGINVF